MAIIRKPLVTAISIATIAMLAACGSSNNDKKITEVPDVSFSEVALPTSDVEKRTIQSTTSITINGEQQTVGFTQLIATGEANNGEVFGLSKDISGNVIQFEDTSNYICNGTNDGVGSGLDFVSILQKHDKLFMVAQFECQVGSMYSAELEQTAEGILSVKTDSLQFVDQSNEFGGWVHCAGQTTPWQSHLGSEEYEPDAASVEQSLIVDGNAVTGSKYYDEAALYHSTTAERAEGHDEAKVAAILRMSPYFVGWTPEVTVTDNTGATEYVKHYSMGRFSHELAYVMPDNKTVYLSDDGTNVGFFMFIADNENDLSAGTLYAAKWNQTSSENGGRADLGWVSLGHTNNATVRAVINKDLAFSDVFSSMDPVAEECTDSTYSYTPYYDECLKVNDVDGSGVVDSTDNEIASRLETRRYAAMLGATLEFRKEEGITFDADNNKVYVAMSEISRGMESFAKYGVADDSYDLGGNNDIQLPSNYCGGVYALDVATGSSKDTSDIAINSAYVVENMNAIITGTEDESVAGNSCDVNGISNPDNVSYLAGSNILTIGEDTSKHENNMIWTLNVKSGELTRIMTTPLDAETTSPFWYKDVNGFGYMTAVAQHPMEDAVGATADDKQSKVGVIGPFNFTKLKD
jgi:secreted PhoX family phosphatase